MTKIQPKSTLDKLLSSFSPAGFYSSAGQTTTHAAKHDVNMRQILWGVCTTGEGPIEVTPLFNGLPAVPSMKLSQKLSRERFCDNYWPEPDKYCSEALQKISVQPELQGYPATLKEVVKAYLPMVLVFFASGHRAKAETIIDFLMHHNVPMCEKQKKLFNRVAVELRRAGHVESALDVYLSIEKYYGADEHVHFNMARTLWDMRKFSLCEKHLVRCVQINPQLEVAQKFLAQLQKVKAKKRAKSTAGGQKICNLPKNQVW